MIETLKLNHNTTLRVFWQHVFDHRRKERDLTNKALLQDKAQSGHKYMLIFRAWRTNPRTGEKEWAKDYGKKAWPILIRK